MQALIITAYKNIEQLNKLIESAVPHFSIFLHIDRKSNINITEVRRQCPEVRIISKYNVIWGGYNHLLAIIELLKMALQDEQITYVHIISGQDILLKNYAEFDKTFLSTNQIYMTCREIEETSEVVKKRLKYRILSANLDGGRTRVKLINRTLYLVQKFFHKERKTLGTFRQIYKGMVWASMPSDAARYAITYADKNPGFMKDLMHTTVPEEFFFQTILMNSEFRENIVCNNLRYTDWNYRNGSCPAILDETDFSKIKKSNMYFARKIDLNISNKLIDMIENARASNITAK